MKRIEEAIISRQEPDKTIFFPVWARGLPNEGIAQYPQVIKTLDGKPQSVALVDDLLPRLVMGRDATEQVAITEHYRRSLPELGFDQVYVLSDLGYRQNVADLFSFCRVYTTNEFSRVLPQRKTLSGGDYLLSEVVEFTWHLGVLRFATESLGCTAFIAGMRTKFFYLAAKKVLPKVNLYFLDMKDK